MKLVSYKGFTLLELMVVLSLTGILSIALYDIFKESSKAVNSIAYRIDSDETLLLLYNQLDKDISAACVPALALAEIAKTEAAEDKDKNTEPQIPTEKQDSTPTIKKVFFGKTNNNLFNTLTLITTHSLSNYNSIQPKFVRVIYKIVPEDSSSAEKPSYKFLRQEMYDLTSKEIDGIKKSYELIDRIKDLKVFFIAQKEDKKTKKDGPKQQDSKIEFITEKNWSSDDLAPKKYIFLPEYVRFEGERWDKKYTKTMPFVFEYKIISNRYYVKEEVQNKKEDKNKKPAAPNQDELSARIEVFMNKKQKK